MNGQASPDDTGNIFQLLPDALREMTDKMEPPPGEAYPDLPEWARRLTWAHSQFEIDLNDLEPFLSGVATGGEAESLVIAFEGTSLDLLPGGQVMAFSATPRAEGRDEWNHPKVTDYWDARVGAIEAAGDRLEKLAGEQGSSALVAVRQAVEERAAALDDPFLLRAAVTLFDDLYKTASSIGYWSESLRRYIEASAGTFCSVLSERGFRVQYLVDNAWTDMARPVQLFPDWFGAAGIGFICPQALVLGQSHGGAVPPMDAATSELMSRHIAPARESVEKAVAAYRDEQFHFVQLDTDMVDSSFETALEARGDQGVLTMYRSEAPEPGSKIGIWPPKGIQLPRAANSESAK